MVHAVQDKHANRNCHEALLRVEIWRPALWTENVCKLRFILICSSLVVICSAYCLHVLFTDAKFCFCVKMGPKQSADSSISQSTESYISNYCSKSFTGCSFESIHWENNQQIIWQHNRLSPKCQSVLLELHLHLWWYRQCLPDILHISYIYYQHINVTLMLPDVFTCNRSEKSPVYCFGCMILYIYLRSFANTFQLLIPMSEH